MDKDKKTLLNQVRHRVMYLEQIKHSIDLQVRYSMARRKSLNSKELKEGGGLVKVEDPPKGGGG